MSTVLGHISHRHTVGSVGSPWTPVDGERVVVYGAGGFAREVIRVLQAANADVAYALDRRGSTCPPIDAVPVHPPGEEPLTRAERADTVAVVGVFNRDANPAEIEDTLEALGYGMVVGVPELYESFADQFGERFWLARRSTYEEFSDRIEEASRLWTDDASRELYEDLVRYRISWAAYAGPVPCDGHQYFPPDVPHTQGPMRLIDCGAFTGDTLASISELGFPVDTVHAFEPDLANVASLAGFARQFSRQNGAEVSVWPCAVAGHIEHRSFQAAEGEASSLSATGSDTVTAVALDDVLPNTRPTDLKLDIEGAELEALQGARELISRSHPRLAVCVYHRPEHLWEIPLLLRDMCPWCDFYLRSHGHYGFDTVMYAVPRVA